MNNERELFEKWFAGIWLGIDLIQTVGIDFAFSTSNGRYCEKVVQEHWTTWQASAQREGFVLVPVEPSEAMVKSADDLLFDPDIGTIDVYKAMIEAGAVK